MERNHPRKRPVLNWAGARIREIRLQQGLSQQMLSARCETSGLTLSRETLSKIEAQVRCLTDMELLTMATVLRVKVKEFFPDRPKLF
jgi:transcriptional regulator with XRE-family HTH domain